MNDDDGCRFTDDERLAVTRHQQRAIRLGRDVAILPDAPDGYPEACWITGPDGYAAVVCVRRGDGVYVDRLDRLPPEPTTGPHDLGAFLMAELDAWERAIDDKAASVERAGVAGLPAWLVAVAEKPPQQAHGDDL
jgi:hypothetical protein